MYRTNVTAEDLAKALDAQELSKIEDPEKRARAIRAIVFAQLLAGTAAHERREIAAKIVGRASRRDRLIIP